MGKNFNRNRTINLIEYVPDVLADVDEYRAVMEIETKTKIKQWDWLERIFDSQFILEAGEFGIALFEKMHEIQRLDTDTLQYRRNRMYQLYNDKPPFTRRWLKSSLDSLLAGSKYSYDIDTEKFTFRICFDGVSVAVLQQVQTWLEKVLPYNMYISNIFVQQATLRTNTASYIRSGKTQRVKAWKEFSVLVKDSMLYTAGHCRHEKKTRVKAIRMDT